MARNDALQNRRPFNNKKWPIVLPDTYEGWNQRIEGTRYLADVVAVRAKNLGGRILSSSETTQGDEDCVQKLLREAFSRYNLRAKQTDEANHGQSPDGDFILC